MHEEYILINNVIKNIISFFNNVNMEYKNPSVLVKNKCDKNIWWFTTCLSSDKRNIKTLYVMKLFIKWKAIV